jgi:hypothetical protein
VTSGFAGGASTHGVQARAVWSRIPRCPLPVRCEFPKNLLVRGKGGRSGATATGISSSPLWWFCPESPAVGATAVALARVVVRWGAARGVCLRPPRTVGVVAAAAPGVELNGRRSWLAPSLTALPNPTGNGGLVVVARSGSRSRMPSGS